MAISELKALVDSGSLSTDTIRSRLMANINIEGRVNETLSRCWGWTKSHSSAGYGQLMICKIPLQAHRLSWWLHNDTPSMVREDVIAHLCDNKTCANPEHLECTSQAKNVKDGYDRGLTVQTKTHLNDGRHLACIECREHTKKKCEYDGDDACTRCLELGLMCVKLPPTPHDRYFVAGACSGESNRACKVSDAQILEMRAKRAAGAKVKDLAAEYGIAASYAGVLINGRSDRIVLTN